MPSRPQTALQPHSNAIIATNLASTQKQLTRLGQNRSQDGLDKLAVVTKKQSNAITPDLVAPKYSTNASTKMAQHHRKKSSKNQ